MRKTGYLILLSVLLQTTANSQSYAEKMAETVARIWGDTINLRPGNKIHWTYDRGVITKGLEYLWYKSGNPKYYQMVKTSMDAFVQPDGSINDYDLQDYNIDDILTGRSLITLFKVTGDEKYKKAATLLRSQLLTHPRTNEGGFWHKKRYPNQMWLDGLYMGEPFYTEYAATFHEDSAFNDIANQFVWMEKHSRDAKTGLMYHGWDESKAEAWANKTTGLSPNFWARAMGWYGMALVDVLESFPKNHPRQKELVAILNRFAAAVKKVQDPKTGLWWDVMDKPGFKNNYLEASAACMLVYTYAKAIRNGWLPASYLPVAKNGYAGILSKFISTDANGNINLEGTVSVSGLGGKPYRDGSFDYYMTEKVVQNDPKGVGAFIKCATEMEMVPSLAIGKGKKLSIDYYFNHEVKKDFAGVPIQWHYTLDEMDNGGFSLLGNIFRKYGVKTEPLLTAPTAQNLKGTDIYLIVDPDNAKESPAPNYITEPSITAIYNWVKAGGVLVIMTNDSANCELAHTNNLAAKFGMHFTNKSRNMVKGSEYETGAVLIPAGHPIFSATKKTYLKEISTIEVSGPAKPSILLEADVVMATAKVGKGTVFAVGDPWLYNEYTDGRKIPAEYQNFQAANDLVQWLISMSANKASK